MPDLSSGTVSTIASDPLNRLGHAVLGTDHRIVSGIYVLVLLLFGFLGRRYFEERRGWTDRRLEMSHDAVEKMVGHRTRLAQERPGAWHGEEERRLDGYEESSRRVDRSSVSSASSRR